MKGDEKSYLNPDDFPLESDPAPSDRYSDPDQTPFESDDEAPLGADGDLTPLDDATALRIIFDKTFKSCDHVEIDETKFKRTSSGLEINGRDVSSLSVAEIDSARELVLAFRGEKSKG